MAGGIVNSVAGGGGFFAFPALLFTGVPSINANATGTVALWPGTLASTGAYRRALSAELLKRILPLIVITFLGSVFGSILLLKTGQATFDKLIPWLLLVATLIFSFSNRVTAWVNRHHSGAGPSPKRVVGITLLQACAAVYIGYFGAGAGFLIMTALALFGVEEMRALNSLKVTAACLSNFCAVVTFVAGGAIEWHYCIVSMVFAGIGGYTGAHYARRMDAGVLRSIVVVTGCAMAAYFFWRQS